MEETRITSKVRKTWWEETNSKNKRRREDNIKLILSKLGWKGMDWIRLDQVINSSENAYTSNISTLSVIFNFS